MSELFSFTSPAFLFRFLPVFFLCYYLVPEKYRDAVALLGSLVFYASGEPFGILLLLALIGVNYLFASQSFRIAGSKERPEEKKKRRRTQFIFACAIDLTVLLLFKALSFAGIAVMPLGLSFYLFKMLSFEADVYNRRLRDKPQLLQVALYFSLFPQISEGPVMRYEEGDFFSFKHFSFERLEEGFKLFALGLSMKILLADRIGILWNDLQMYGYESISTPAAWLGAFAYSFELYYDFYGYSLMAAGLFMMMGYNFIRNFEDPYASRTISEFYRRWHITLGAFFRDYVYIPTGGSRGGKGRTVRNLLIVWLLTGLWHGNGANFLLWGAVLGLLIVLEKLFYGKWLSEHPFFGHLYVLLLIPLTWVIFAIGDFKDLGLYYGRLFPLFGVGQGADWTDVVGYLKDYACYFIAAILLCLPYGERLYVKFRRSVPVLVLLTVCFWFAVYYIFVGRNNPFMYLKF